MKHYTESISPDLAKKLKEKGMPIEMQPLYAQVAPNARGIVKAGVGIYCPPYAEVFDWLMDKGIDAEVYLSMTHNGVNGVVKVYAYCVHSSKHLNEEHGEQDTMSWTEAAEAAITKALELI